MGAEPGIGIRAIEADLILEGMEGDRERRESDADMGHCCDSEKQSHSDRISRSSTCSKAK